MAEVVYILSPSYVKDTTRIHSGVDDEFLYPIIEYVQDIYINRITGSPLLDQIKSQISAGTLTALNTTLLGYLVKAARYYVVAQGIQDGQLKVTAKGTVVKSGDGADPATSREVNLAFQQMRDKGEYYATRAVMYLMENETDYPLYNNPGSGCDIIWSDRNMYDYGVNL